MNLPSRERIIKNGLLPESLPPPFTSDSFWTVFENQSSYLVSSRAIGQLSSYNASKRGGLRRQFAIPHPLFVNDSALFIERHWNSITELLQKATGSLSHPIFAPIGMRAVHITPHSELPKKRLQAFSRFVYCAVTDVARCYPSIYSHCIPWALNGRESAKADRNANSAAVYGNRLDFIMRQGQDGQTVGIPVGPDTSKVICEIVLSAVDGIFLSKYKRKPPAYLRHVDDYWIGANTFTECEEHLQNLRDALREFQLDLNDLKTKIVRTHRALGESWPAEFERDLRQNLRADGNNFALPNADPVSTLSKIVDRAISENDDGMIRFAIRKIDENKLWQDWDIVEHFLAQCAIQFSHSFDYVARIIAWRARTGKSYDRALWREVAETCAAQSSLLGKDAETLWSLWLIVELNHKVPNRITETICRRSSPVVLAYLAHAFAQGRTRDRDIRTMLWGRVEGNPYCGSAWPLALELVNLEVPGFNPALFGTTPDQLKRLHEEKLSLIDWAALPRVFTDIAGKDVPDPDHAIEDFSSDYAEFPWDEDSDEKAEIPP